MQPSWASTLAFIVLQLLWHFLGCCLVTKVVSNSFATLRTVTHQAPLSMEFSKQEYWTGCHFLLQGTFPTQGSHPRLLHRQAGSLPLSRQGRPVFLDTIIYKTKLWVHFLWKSYHKVEGLCQNWVSQLHCAQGSPRSFVKRQLLVLWCRWGPRRCISDKFQVSLMLHVYTVGFRIKLKQKSWQSFLKSQAKQEQFNDNIHDREMETAFQKWYFNATFQKTKYCVRHKI